MMKVDGSKVRAMMEATQSTVMDLVQQGLTYREVDRALMGDRMTDRTLNKLAKAIGVQVEKLIA